MVGVPEEKEKGKGKRKAVGERRVSTGLVVGAIGRLDDVAGCWWMEQRARKCTYTGERARNVN